MKYSTDEFLSKNVDAVVPEHHRLLSQSKDQVLRDIFSEESAPEVGQFTSIGLSFKVTIFLPCMWLQVLSQCYCHFG